MHPLPSRIPGIDSMTRHAIIHLPISCTSKVVGDLGAEDPLFLSLASPKSNMVIPQKAAHHHTTQNIVTLHIAKSTPSYDPQQKQPYATCGSAHCYDSYHTKSRSPSNHHKYSLRGSLYKEGPPPTSYTSSPSKDLYAFLSAHLRFLWKRRGLSLQNNKHLELYLNNNLTNKPVLPIGFSL